MQKQNMTEKYCFGKKRLKKGGMWSKTNYVTYFTIGISLIMLFVSDLFGC